MVGLHTSDTSTLKVKDYQNNIPQFRMTIKIAYLNKIVFGKDLLVLNGL